MYTIQISVRDKIATQTDGTVIINGNSDYNIEFDFDAEWADLNNKIGIFAYNDAAAHKWAYQTVTFSGNTCTVPILRDIHCVYVGVTAGNVRVTTPAKVQCRLSISDYADTEEPPSADIWGQILAKLDELQTEIDEIKAGGVGGTPDWAQNDATMSDYIKNRPFFDISEVQPDPNQFVDIVSMSVNDLVKLNDYQNMIMVWKSIDNVLSNLGSPWFIFRFFSTKFNKEIDFLYELYTNRQDITMLDDTNFYTEFVASFGADGQKKARIYFILDTTKLDTASAALFNSKGVYYKCVESMSSLQSCKIGMMYKTVKRLESRYLRNDVESARCKVGKLEDANNPDNNYPSVKAVNLALDKKLTRLNTVISYDSENSKYVSSVDFALLLAAAQQPDKYIVTATKSEQSDLTTSSTKEDLYILTGIDNTDAIKALTFACSAVKKTSIGTIEKNEEKRICITDNPDDPVSFLSENVTSALKETGKGAIYRSSTTSDVDALGANSVNLATRSGSTGVSAFATGYGVYNPRYGWGYLANNASGDNSAAFGSNTTATQEAQFVCGKQNEADTEGRYQFIVGIGGKNGFAVTTNGEIVLPAPNASPTKYMKARFNSDGTITLSPVADDTASYTTECTANRVTAITAESTDAQYPTAKAVYDALQGIDIPSGTDISLNVTGATVGQTIKVKAVDADGKPTAWEAVDMAAGEAWETLAETTLEEESVPILDIGAMASSFSRLRFYFTFPIVESVEKVHVWLATPIGVTYTVALINRGNDKSESWAFIDFYPLIYNGICYMSMIESAKVGITNNTTQQFQYNSYDYYRISEARYVRTNKPLPTGATITIMGVRK